jgi:hypothetical protein
MPAPGPKPCAVLGRRRAQEVIDFDIFDERLAQVAFALDPCLYQMVAMDGGGHRDMRAPCLHKLQHTRLSQHILKNNAVGTQEEIALARLQVLVFRIVKVPEQHLVRQGKRFAKAPAYHLEILGHRLVDFGDHFLCGFDGKH